MLFLAITVSLRTLRSVMENMQGLACPLTEMFVSAGDSTQSSSMRSLSAVDKIAICAICTNFNRFFYFFSNKPFVMSDDDDDPCLVASLDFFFFRGGR